MASTMFIDNQTIIYASWLNDVNGLTYNGTLLNGVLNGPTTLALQTGGLNALTIDGSQNVTVTNLSITGTFSAPLGLTFGDGTKQTSAAYCVANNCMYENNHTITASYTITTGRSASSVGPISIASGQTVTVPSGSKWVVL
jgi:hypothetical protein